MKKILIASTLFSAFFASASANAAAIDEAGKVSASADIVVTGPAILTHTMTPVALTQGAIAGETVAVNGVITKSGTAPAYLKFTNGVWNPPAGGIPAFVELSGTNNTANKLRVKLATASTDGSIIPTGWQKLLADNYSIVTTTTPANSNVIADTYVFNADAAVYY